MTIGTSDTFEKEMMEIRMLLEHVNKENEEKNRKIEELQNELMKIRGKQKLEEEVTPMITEHDDNQEKIVVGKAMANEDVAYNEKQLQIMIANAVKTQLGGSSSIGVRYSKPYTRRIDSLRMPLGYQPPKFQQFDGKGNPRQHVAHFIETCNNAGTEGDLLVKQFVRSLRGIAFDWYTDLDAESIDSWEHMEDEFLNRFYSTRRIVSMSELTNTRQWENEPVVDYINRWRALSLECKDRISETSAVEMCIDGMSWELLYILKGIKPRSFQELATRAHDMEITVKGHGKNRNASSKTTVEKKEFKKNEKTATTASKEAMIVGTNSTAVKISGKPKHDKKKEFAPREFKRDRPTLKELQAKKYPFPDSDLSGMLDDLLEKNVIKLPEPKRPDEVNRTNDPKYCRYHRLVSHSIEDCITLKELIMRLAREGKILLETDEAVEVNHASATMCQQSRCSMKNLQKYDIQFGSLAPVEVRLQGSSGTSHTVIQDMHTSAQENMDDDEGWTVVTRRKPRKIVLPKSEFIYRRKKQEVKRKPHSSKGKKRVKKTKKKSYVEPTDLLKQKPPKPTTLGDFFPKGFLDGITVNTVSHTEKVSTKKEVLGADEASSSTSPPKSKVQQHDEATKDGEFFPTCEILEQSDCPPRGAQHPVIQTPHSSNADKGDNSGTEEAQKATTKCISCNTALTFSDEDLLLGSKPHNRPLYVTGYIRGQQVCRILVDGGSGVNLMPKATMNELGITMHELSDSRTVIHGFNLNGERAIGMIRVNLTLSDLSSETLFHVIESKTSFKLLLGRPWQHENGVIASTLHQCLKYYRGGERKINGDTKPFTKADSFFADAKFFENNGVSSELLPSVISSTGEGSMKRKNVVEQREIASGTQSPKEYQSKPNTTSMTSIRSLVDTMESKHVATTPVLRYIPKSRRKNGESPFAECKGTTLKSPGEKVVKEIVKQEWLAKVILPLSSTTQTHILEPPLTGFVFSSDEISKEEASIRGRFDSNAYKLMEKSGYNFKHPSPLGKMVKPHPYGLNQMQGITPKHVGLGYEVLTPVKISARRKGNISSVHCIIPEGVEESNEGSTLPSTSSVFDRIRPSTSEQRASVFSRITVPMKIKSKTSVFNRLATHVQRNKKSYLPSRRRRNAVFDRLALPVGSVFNRLKGPSQVEDQKKGEDITEQDTVTSCHVTVEEVPEEKIEEEVEADQAPRTLEDGGQSTVDDLIELNLGSVEEPRPIYVSALLTEEEKEKYFNLLIEYKDVFAWNYTEMPGLSPTIAVHRLAIKKGVKPKKQAQRRFRPELIPEIEKEVNKLIDAGFIQEVKYPTWIANIVPVRKKNGQLRVCVDFRDLNDACPKDDFPLPVTELMIDATTEHEALSFMDCTAGYNQIRMAPEDQEATAFRTPKGIFCYRVMPFGLKNAGATYQRAMQKIFDDMMHKTIECYVDDVVVKSKAKADHIKDLRSVFNRLRECKLKMNPLKCAFGVTSGKFLGFVVTHRGIEIDQTKIKAIQEMPEPKNLKELRGLQGRLAYIRRFISNLAGRCQPFSHLMRKDAPFEWDDKCRNAFASIKKYLSTAPVLGAPIPGRPLILYIAAQERSLGAMCAQENEHHKERALYYLVKL